MTDRATGSDLDAIHKSMNTLNYESLKPLITSDDSMALFALMVATSKAKRQMAAKLCGIRTHNRGVRNVIRSPY